MDTKEKYEFGKKLYNDINNLLIEISIGILIIFPIMLLLLLPLVVQKH